MKYLGRHFFFLKTGTWCSCFWWSFKYTLPWKPTQKSNLLFISCRLSFSQQIGMPSSFKKLETWRDNRRCNLCTLHWTLNRSRGFSSIWYAELMHRGCLWHTSRSACLEAGWGLHWRRVFLLNLYQWVNVNLKRRLRELSGFVNDSVRAETFHSIKIQLFCSS